MKNKLKLKIFKNSQFLLMISLSFSLKKIFKKNYSKNLFKLPQILIKNGHYKMIENFFQYFYNIQALKVFGTDFSMIKSIFPNRTRI